MMKTFEEIYRDAAVRNGCNAGKTFARVMFEEGMSQNLERCMDRAAGSHTDLMAFAGWFGKRLAKESVRCNATRVNFSQDITIEGKKYTTRFGTVTFSTEEKKSLEERAEGDCRKTAVIRPVRRPENVVERSRTDRLRFTEG